jgi:hypothetical protein
MNHESIKARIRKRNSTGPTQPPSALSTFNTTVYATITTLGVIWAFASGLINYFEARGQAERDLLLAETVTISALASSIGLVRYNCADSFDTLVTISPIERAKESQKNVCYEAFLELSRNYYPAALTLSKPKNEENIVLWDSAWRELGEAIARSGVVRYDRTGIICSWQKILGLRELDLPSLVGDSCPDSASL